ncbi:MAG: type II secretion system protein GspG [Bacillota bacterium]
MFLKSKLRKHASRKDYGFTLIELIVVIAIIGVIAIIAIPRLTNRADDARARSVEATLRSMRTVLDVYRTDYQRYPDGSEIGSVMQDHGIDWTGAAGGQVDPWGNGYAYGQLTTDTFALASKGPDSTANTADDFYVTELVQPTQGNTAGILDGTDEDAVSNNDTWP